MPEQEHFIDATHHRRNILPIIQDSATGWYKGWYFDLRFREECERAMRHNLALSVVCVRLRSAEDAGAVKTTLIDAGRSLLRSTDIPCQLNERDFIFCLPHTDQDGAAVVMERLVSLLSEFHPTVGRASYPLDAEDADFLIDRAFNRALYGRPLKP